MCTALSETCGVPTVDAGKGYTALPGDAAAAAVGGTFVLTCATAGHVVAGTADASLTLNCGVVAADSDPWYEVKLDQDPAVVAACEAPPASSRRRRAAEKEKGERREGEWQI